MYGMVLVILVPIVAVMACCVIK